MVFASICGQLSNFSCEQRAVRKLQMARSEHFEPWVLRKFPLVRINLSFINIDTLFCAKLIWQSGWALANNSFMDVIELALTWAGRLNGKKKTCLDLRANLISTKVSASQRKYTRGLGPNGVACRPKFSTCVYLRVPFGQGFRSRYVLLNCFGDHTSPYKNTMNVKIC